MSIDPQTSRFWKETLRHGLLDEASLRACWDAIPPDKRDDPDAVDRRMARQAVASQCLTLWQAQQVLAGRAAALKIGKYVVMDIVGKGGMGLVFLARDTRLRRPVAIKVLSRERMTSPRAMARFEREAKVGAQLQHDNLVRIYDEGEHRELRYLVMEYIEGRNVSQILADVGRLPPALAASIARQVALGLEHARLKGLIHRDVNPQNILVTRDGVAKLTDLGLAIDLGDPDDVVTRDGATVGTFDYISPEQARHPRSVDTRSDLYSLGCTMYHMISGRVPFREASLPEKLYAHQLHEPEPLSALVPDIPTGLEAIVRRLMAKSPDDRFATPQALADALAPFAEGAASVAELLAASRQPSEDGNGAAGPPAGMPLEAGSDPNGYRLGPASARSELPPTRTASAMKPQPDARESSGLGPSPVPSPSDSDPGSPAPPDASRPSEAGPRPALTPERDISGLGLAIDLGPELSLTESLASSRSRSRASVSRSGSGTGSSDKVKAGPSQPPDAAGGRPAVRRKAIALGAMAAALCLAALAAVALILPRGDGRPDADAPEGTPAQAETGTPPGGPAEPPVARPALSVGRRDGTGLIPVPSFHDALMMAPKNGGTVYVSESSAPLRIAPEDSAFLAPNSSTVIRPHPGTRPTLLISLEGKDSWLRLQAGSLTIEDLTVAVRYGGPGAPGDPRPPLIDASGELTLRRCAFSVQEGPSPGSSVVRSSGQPVRVEGCLFRGFDRPLDLVAFGGVRHEVTDSIFAWNRGSAGRPGGWPVRISSRFAAHSNPAQVTIDRCSALMAAGLVETSSLMADYPLELRVSRSAVRADHLLCWAPPAEGAAFPAGLRWIGQGNRYDLQGASWVVSSADGLSAPAGAPTDLDSWLAALGDRGEDDSAQALIELRDPSATDAVTLDPSRFAVLSGGEPIGADPALVGPVAGPPPAQP